MLTRILALAILMLIVTSTASHAANNDELTIGLRIYSGMNFVKAEGEYYGLQIVVVPYFRGQKILWRSGSGHLESPLLLDVVREGKKMKVVVPEGDDNFGEWILSQDGKILHAQGPRDLHFDLREVFFQNQ